MSVSIDVAYLDPINVSEELFEAISEKVIDEAWEEVMGWLPAASGDAEFEARLNEHLDEVYVARVTARMEQVS